MMNGFDEIFNWLYSDGDLIMFAARTVAFIFVLEASAYIVGLVAGISKAASK